jgi:hypothetical protein
MPRIAGIYCTLFLPSNRSTYEESQTTFNYYPTSTSNKLHITVHTKHLHHLMPELTNIVPQPALKYQKNLITNIKMGQKGSSF